MAYADYGFYTGSYYGDVLTAGNAPKWLERASDELDLLTFGRLQDYYPTDADIKVKKATCAIAETLCRIDQQRAAASAQLDAASGQYRAAVASISSGRESVSYAVSGTAGSIYAAAAADDTEAARLVENTAVRYLANVPDARGVNLLYAGWERPYV